MFVFINIINKKRSDDLKKTYILFLILFILSITSLFIGVKQFELVDILTLSEEVLMFLTMSRIPRLLALIFTGIGLSLSGLIMQTISRNKFVSPSTAATIDSARFGILIGLIFFASSAFYVKTILAFLFAFLGTLLFMKLISMLKAKNMLLIPLLGIVLGTLIDALTSLIAYRFDVIQLLNSSLVGDFSLIVQGRYELLYIMIPVVIILYLYSYQFSIAGLGEDVSKNLGLHYNQVVIIGIALVAIISATTIITVGNIPFLGLIVPNIVMMIHGNHLKKNMVPTSLFGAILVISTDIVGRVIIFPYEIPIGLSLGVVGSLIFLYLLLRRPKYVKQT